MTDGAARFAPGSPFDGEARVAWSSTLLVRRRLRRNFIRMSLWFSLNHACVTAALALSTANLGPTLGNTSNAVLYVFYTGTALLYAGPHVRWRGSKAALVDSTFGFCVYVGSFYVAEVWTTAAWGAAILGAAVGGVAAGILFTAQGVYFTFTARAYAQLSRSESDSVAQGSGSCGTGEDCSVGDLGRRRLGRPDRAMEEATALFASLFATIYLLCEITFKLVAWILPMYWPAGWAVVSLTYFATAVGAAAAMVTIWRLEADSDDGPPNSKLVAETSPSGSSHKELVEETEISTDVRLHVSMPDLWSNDGSVTARTPALEIESESSTAVPQRYRSSSPSGIGSDTDTARATGLGYLRELLLLLCERQMLLAMGLNLACTHSSPWLTPALYLAIFRCAYFGNSRTFVCLTASCMWRAGLRASLCAVRAALFCWHAIHANELRWLYVSLPYVSCQWDYRSQSVRHCDYRYFGAIDGSAWLSQKHFY